MIMNETTENENGRSSSKRKATKDWVSEWEEGGADESKEYSAGGERSMEWNERY